MISILEQYFIECIECFSKNVYVHVKLRKNINVNSNVLFEYDIFDDDSNICVETGRIVFENQKFIFFEGVEIYSEDSIFTFMNILNTKHENNEYKILGCSNIKIVDDDFIFLINANLSNMMNGGKLIYYNKYNDFEYVAKSELLEVEEYEF